MISGAQAHYKIRNTSSLTAGIFTIAFLVASTATVAEFETAASGLGVQGHEVGSERTATNSLSAGGAGADRTDAAIEARPDSTAAKIKRIPKSVNLVDIQAYSVADSLLFIDKDGAQGEATLVNLNPNINIWYLLKMRWPGQANDEFYHLENPDPSRRLLLGPQNPHGLIIAGSSGSFKCDLWKDGDPARLRSAALIQKPFAGLCAEQIYLRNKSAGHKSAKEWVVDFLRDNMWGGESVTTFVKETFFKDKFLINAVLNTAEEGGGEPSKALAQANVPRDAQVSLAAAGKLLEPKSLGIEASHEPTGMRVGRWYPHKQHKGIFVSMIEPGLVSEEIVESHKDRVDKLDKTEGAAVSYLIAYDVDLFEVGFALGTDHPRLGWSERALEQVVDRSRAGPEGVGSPEPLVLTGRVNPVDSRKLISTFAAGFKRAHGAFKWGKLAYINHGSHYGFMENGVVFSALHPGLSTLIVERDGRVVMKTWAEEDNGSLPRIRHARQNGVPIIDYDEKTGESKPGELVKHWGAGNWSGSADSKFRTLRAGACLQPHSGKRFLLYGYFSSATPSAMARVFQAYGCRYAMHLDMNALEHTYLAVYSLHEDSYKIEHLIKGMNASDKQYQGKDIPRFVGFSDNRDFFYLLHR